MIPISQSFQILQTTSNALSLIEESGRTCYKSFHKIGCILTDAVCIHDASKCNAHCPNHSARAFARMIISKGHESVLEHAHMTVRITTDRAVTHELVRHRLASYSQESQRYVRYKDNEIRFIIPEQFYPLGEDATDSQEYNHWREACMEAEKRYIKLLDCGCAPQLARRVLPNSTATEIVITANFREWRHIFRMRTSSAADLQIQTLFKSIQNEAAFLVPEIFDNL